MVFRAKRAVKIVTTRLALISIGRIYGGEIFKSSTSDITICQNSYFCKMYHIFDQDFDFALISVLYLYRNIICGHLMPGLRPITTSKLINILGMPVSSKSWLNIWYILQNMNFDRLLYQKWNFRRFLPHRFFQLK